MKLTTVQITNFRCVEDSEVFTVGSLTSLVGKNESGKTSILQAIEKLNPVDVRAIQIDKYRDYPRHLLNEYDPEAPMLVTTWALDPADRRAVEGLVGKGCLASDEVSVTLRHGGQKIWDIDLDQRKLIDHFVSEAGCDAIEAEQLKKCKLAGQLAEASQQIEASERLTSLRDKLSAFRDSNPVLGTIDLLSARMPKMLYFSNYDRMRGAVALTDLHNRKAANQLTKDDEVFLSFLEFAGTSIEEVVGLKQYEPLKAKAEAAGIGISKRIFKYWSQNRYLKVQFDVSAALAQDAAPFNEGMIVRTRILNTLHDMTVEFDNRSAGFVWFFSFLVLFSQVAKQQGNVIILLDEPGMTLHGKAQADLLKFFEEELEPSHQIIFTTHSPFMVPARRLECVRTVEDMVREVQGGPPEVFGTKVGDEVLSLDPDTVFPLQGALGYDIAQSLFIGPDTLLVEGPSDLLYIQAMSSELRRRGREGLSSGWTVCPSGGIDKVGAFLSLFAGNKLHVAVLTDYASGQKGKVEQLKASKLLRAGHVLLASDYSKTPEADIEDILGDELYLQIVNHSLGASGKKAITAAHLTASGESSPRVVKRVEAVLRTRADLPEFDHFIPADWMIRNPGFLESDPKGLDGALDRFEALFSDLNKLL